MHTLPGRFANNSHPTYAVLRELNAGGMGFILLVEHRQTGHKLALKFILTEHADIVDLERFQREGQLLAALNHPHIVKVHSYESEAGTPFLAMEWIEGESLKNRIQRAAETEAFPALHEVWEVFRALIQALDHCHRQGILHRDLKPDNVLIEKDTERVVLVDFGLAKQVRRVQRAEDQSLQLTQTGQILGTPAYMSPEQIHLEDGPIGPAADVWGLGATLFEFTTLTAPFQSDSVLSLMTKILDEAPHSPQSLRSDCPEWLTRVCLACLNKSPSERPKTEELLELFHRNEPEFEDHPQNSNKALFFSLAVVFLIGLSVPLYFLLQPSSASKESPDVNKKSLPTPTIKVAGLVDEAVYLKAGAKSRIEVSHGARIELTIDGVTEVFDGDSESKRELFVEATAKIRSVKVVAKNKDSDAETQSYFLVPQKFKNAFQCRALFDRLDWNRAKDYQQDAIVRHVERLLGSAFQFEDTKLYECRQLRHRIASFRHKETGIRFHLIPGGSFQFGSSSEARFAFNKYLAGAPYENPEMRQIQPTWKLVRDPENKYLRGLEKMLKSEFSQSEQTVGPFLMAQYELSRREWQKTPGDVQLMDTPKTSVTYKDVKKWLKTVRGPLHLPSEVQWEYACRAGSTEAFFWGNAFSPLYAWTLESANMNRDPFPLRQKDRLPNAFGLISITGNVWEFCDDSFLLKALPQPFAQPYRDRSSLVVARGGSTHFLLTFCRSAARRKIEKKRSGKALGARLAAKIFSLEEIKFISAFNKR